MYDAESDTPYGPATLTATVPAAPGGAVTLSDPSLFTTPVTELLKTTPNAEYNVLFETLPSGTMRHRDHRFEWTRSQFGDWSAHIAATHGYSVKISGIGPEDENAGAPSQMAVFNR